MRKLGRAVEQSPSIVTITDPRGRSEYANPKFTEVTGYSLEEVLGRNPRILKSGDKPAEEYRTLWRTIAGGGEWRGEFHNRRKNGELYWESASISALRDDSGQVTHFLAVKEDITERKRLEQEVERRNRELVQAQALAEVGRMATMIAHDLRNPLSSVKIALQVLSKQTAPSGEAGELRDIAREQVAYMEAILSDMLTFARPQAPALEWLSADRLLQPVVTLAERRLAGQGVELDARYRDGLPTFPGDPNQLHLQAQGHQASVAHSVDAGLSAAQGEPPALVSMDIRMPGRSGLEGLVDFRTSHPSAPVIMITAFHDMESTIEAMQKGAVDYIHKPIDIDELDEAVAQAIQGAGERIALAEGPREMAGEPVMVGRSRAMKEVFKTIGLVAKSPATVLITGESGTGKELVARAVHRSGENPAGPFVVVNCAALVETLLESDMFGHERGAFTGAVSRQIGKLALARGGTIFLDEISELSPAMQAKLLRVLQDKEFVPLGAQRLETTDARMLAATNADLAQRVRDGAFREDLLFRLQVVNIHLPPLRDRREDLPDLVEALLARINRESDRRTTHLAADVMDCFLAHGWPGNVRELENRLMKAVALSQGPVLTRDLFGPDLCPATEGESERDTPRSRMSLAEVEREHVQRVLQDVRWHKGRACEVLGVSRPRLRRLIRDHGLLPPAGLSGRPGDEPDD